MRSDKEIAESRLIAAQNLKENVEKRIKEITENFYKTNVDPNAGPNIEEDEKLLSEANQAIKDFTKDLENLN